MDNLHGGILKQLLCLCVYLRELGLGVCVCVGAEVPVGGRGDGGERTKGNNDRGGVVVIKERNDSVSRRSELCLVRVGLGRGGGGCVCVYMYMCVSV